MTYTQHYDSPLGGILLAAKILREGKIPEKKEDFQVGSRVHRIDVAEKVQGYGKSPDDVYMGGLCCGGAVRSQYPRARVLYIRTKEAEALPGVVCVLTAKDIPGQQNVGHIQKDQPTLIGEGEITQYLGDAVALVCARDLETLEQAKKLVRVVYEELPAVYGPEEASAPGAPEVIMGNRGNLQAHRHVVRGNADEAIKHSKYVLHEKFETPWTEHAFLEPECCVALPLENGGVKLLTTDQSAHTTQHECSAMLGVDFAHCQVENMLVGGGFGGKEDMSVQHHAALIAYIARVPVKVKLTRQESLLVHPKRHPMWMDFTMGCDENGIIQGVKASVVSDTGGFASLGGPALARVDFPAGAMLAQLGTPDMKLPIRYAMTYPNRAVSPAEPLDLLKCPPLTFAEPDEEVFRCLKIAKQCAAIGNVYCAAMNGANEEAVAAFLCDEIGICAIPDLIEAALDKTETVYQPQLSDILEADRLAREVVREKLN